MFALASALLAACAADSQLDENHAAAAIDETEPGEELDRDAQQLRGATDQRPCAEQTVAHLALPNGNPASFCVTRKGGEVYGEVTNAGERSYLDEIGLKDARRMCVVDIYMAVTDERKPLPRRLLDACPTELRRRDDYLKRQLVDTYFEETREAPPPRANFCLSGGQAAFEAQCMTCAPYDDCFSWCHDEFWGAHQRTMTNPAFIGEEGNEVFELNASCFGNTLVRMWEREDEGDAWGSPDLQKTVTAGKSFLGGIIHHSLFQDYDFRARGDSASGAAHRHTGTFEDY